MKDMDVYISDDRISLYWNDIEVYRWEDSGKVNCLYYYPFMLDEHINLKLRHIQSAWMANNEEGFVK